jgi:hypothetical protein
MLRRVMQELEAAQGLVSLDELGHRLGVERSALEGMIQTLVRMGRLRDDSATAAACAACGSPLFFPKGHRRTQGGCADCSAAQSCALAAKLPATYSLVTQHDANRG